MDNNIKGKINARPIFSEYLNPKALGIKKLKSRIRKEINKTEIIPAKSSE
jgi:hypothetical protein